MPSVPVLVGALVAVIGVLTALVLVYLGMRSRRARLERRLNHVEPGDASIMPLTPAEQKRLGWAQRMDRSFDEMVRRTGLELTGDQALGFICVVGALLAAGLYFWRGELWLSVLGLFAGMAGMLVVFLFLQRRYRRQLQNQLPDIFFLLARSLRAGLSLEQAIALAGDQGGKPLGPEFQRCAGQIKLGLSVPAALELMARRLQLLDFNIFVSTVALHYHTGGNLALLLDRLAASTRDHNQFVGHFRAATALGRITATFIGAVVPFLLLVYAVFEPEHIQAFFQNATGWLVLCGVLLLELIGIVWMYRLLRVDY
jgi:tight adherence protein B